MSLRHSVYFDTLWRDGPISSPPQHDMTCCTSGRTMPPPRTAPSGLHHLQSSAPRSSLIGRAFQLRSRWLFKRVLVCRARASSSAVGRHRPPDTLSGSGQSWTLAWLSRMPGTVRHRGAICMHAYLLSWPIMPPPPGTTASCWDSREMDKR